MRKIVVLVMLFTLLSIPGCSTSNSRAQPPLPDEWPTSSWQTSTPEEQGFDSVKLAEGLQAMQEKGINIHSLTVIRNDAVILDAYFYPYDGTTVHELASVTKSVITTLIGIAADKGKLSLDDRMVSFFPEWKIANPCIFKNFITVRQLAGMTSGLDCSSANDEQTLTEMGSAPDWVQFTLNLKAKYIPGSRFEYCSPGMHLLSAILQKATGMQASEFARINFFEPLGIKNVIWEQDPQGYSDGWAGLYLQPVRSAKIGYLMLHQGQWDGRQIVSSNWVEQATRFQKKTGQGDNYGYGWWVPSPAQFVEFAAEGRGGQYIRVIPELNMVVVSTGGGFDWNDIVPLLLPAMVEISQPLPANPSGVNKLEATLAAILQIPPAKLVSPLPEIARRISGKIYGFEPNPIDIKTLQLAFSDSPEAHLVATFYNQPDEDLLIGMDGVYRMYPIGEHGLPMGLRGSWTDPQTFLFEYDEIANREAYSLEMHFNGDQVTILAKERTHAAVATVEGKILK